jgi:hypothetical protein
LAIRILVLVLSFAPLAYGSVQPWAWGMCTFAVGLGLMFWTTGHVLGKARPVVGLQQLSVPAGLFSLVVLWIIVQGTVWTPAAWHHPIWSIAATALNEPIEGRISIDPESGQLSLIRLLTYAGVFWIALQYGRDSRRARICLQVFVVSAAACSALGFLVWGSGLETFLWFDSEMFSRPLAGERLAVPFVNPNHLATFAGSALVAAIGLIIGETRGLWRPETELREKLWRFLNEVLAKRFYLLIAFSVLLTATVLTQSRAGLVATAFGVFVLVAALQRREGFFMRHMVMVACGALLLAFVVIGRGTLVWIDRFSSASLEQGLRAQIYGNTIEAISASPWLGYGFGSFPSIYRVYNDHDARQIVEAAHNAYLETMVELGIPAALMLFCAVGACVLRCWNGARRRRRDADIPAIGAATAMVFLSHSIVDFPLQVPAIAMGFAFLLGIGFSQSWSSLDRS